MTGHGNGAGGAAFAAIKLEERLSVVERPAHSEPDKDAYRELRVELPTLCPDS